MAIHPTAVIEDGAVIGDGVHVGPHAVIHRYARVGRGCRIHAGAVIGDDPQDIGFRGDESWVELGEGCVIREHVTIHRASKAGSTTRIGDRCFLMANSHVAHDAVLGNQVILANGALVAGHVQISDSAFISGNAAIHQFVRIGRLAMISGCGGISKDVPPFCTTRGASLNTVSAINTVGLRRAGLSPADRSSVKQAFRMLFRSSLNTSDAVAEIQRQFTTGPARELADFVAGSKRGIVAYRSARSEEMVDED